MCEASNDLILTHAQNMIVTLTLTLEIVLGSLPV